MAPYYNNPGQVNDEALNIAGGRTYQVIQLADSEGNVIDPASGEISLSVDELDIQFPDEFTIVNTVDSPVNSSLVSKVDQGNTTNSNLSAGATFTGTGVLASPTYGTISVCIISSHNSAVNGLKFQASTDNINWENIEQYSYVAANGLKSYSFSPSGLYFRLTYTNGSTTTTKLAILTVLRNGPVKASSHRIKDNIDGEHDAELVKAVLAAEMPNGMFTDINATAGGNLKISLEEVNGIDPIPVTATALPLPDGAATETTLSSVNGKLPALSDNRVPVVGPLTDTELRANPVVVSGAVVTTTSPHTPTTTSVASSATSVTILAANANRRGVSIANDSTATLRLSFATPATTANAFIVLPPGSFLLLDQQLIVTNVIYGIWSAANGTAQVTEYV